MEGKELDRHPPHPKKKGGGGVGGVSVCKNLPLFK